jgi:phenylacetic acid degradation operon negative regulatory protein
MLKPLLAHWRERPQRTWSVIVTVFGDAVVPRGGSVPLGALIELAGALGIDAGAVRTAMSRLVADGWTERRRVGRSSAYQLTPKGQTVFTSAASRIYAARAPAWEGAFHLVLQPENRAALEEAGFGQALPGLWVAAQPSRDTSGLTLTATCDRPTARALTARAWPLELLAAAFTRFNTAFADLPAASDPAPLEAMAARTLLVHEYRRIVLFAPDLPAELLPTDWPGEAARQLCAAAYRGLLPASEHWLDSHDLPPPDLSLLQRFVL